MAQKLLLTLNVDGSIITTLNQQGGQTAHSIVNYFYQQPAPSPAVLMPVIEWLLAKVDHEMGIDYYDFRVSLRNDGTTTVREFSIEIEIPNIYLNQSTIYVAEVRGTPESRLFRNTQKNFNNLVLYPGDVYPVFGVGYQIIKEQYRAGIRDSIVVSVYSGDQLLSKSGHPIANMLNPERVQHILQST